MKFLSLLAILAFSFLGLSQKIEFLSAEKMAKKDLSKFTYVNASDKDVPVWEEGLSYMLDFQIRDCRDDFDSIIIRVGDERYHTEFLSPFILRQVPEDAMFKMDAFVNGESVGFVSHGGDVIRWEFEAVKKPLFVNDTIVFGILAVVLAFIFYTSSKDSKGWSKFYRVVPALLLCYLFPALLNTLGWISKDYSELYTMAKNYLLPGALILMTLGIDFKGLINLGPKALIMFVTATVGIVFGGPFAIWVFQFIDPSVVGGEGYDAAWRGLSTLAGSWIGGGANQAAMLETFKYNQDLYGKMVTVDIVVANLWMAFLLWGATRANKFDKWLKADSSAIEDLKERTMNYQSSINRIPSLTDLMVILGLTFGIVAVGHLLGEKFSAFFLESLGKESPFASTFFWIVVIATTGGLLLSLSKARRYEGAGASKIGSVFIYILVATIGMKMELEEAVKEPLLILVGIIWMVFHVAILFIVAKLIKAPFFFVAVGSKANVGGAASAPVVAAAFHPSLASVGAILAVLGYALGTYGALASALMMKWVAGG